jgi:hypothetical protein
VANEKIKLPDALLNKLKRNKNTVKSLIVKKKKTLKAKRNLLVRGKFLPQLLGVLGTTLVTELIQNVIDKNKKT